MVNMTSLYPNAFAARARLSAIVRREMRIYAEEEGFTEIEVPCLSRGKGSCESPSTMFTLDYFGEKVFLNQTGQLYLEECIPILKRVYCCQPVFRAEDKADGRHLTQFTLFELEQIGELDSILQHIERMINRVLKTVIDTCNGSFEELSINPERLTNIEIPFKRMSYDEAIEKLELKWGTDIDQRQEQNLLMHSEGQPLFVVNHPENLKFFNSRCIDNNSNVVASADLILPISGEAVGASEREFRYDLVLNKLQISRMLNEFGSIGKDISVFDSYLKHLRNRGSVLHSGCGIGISRLVQFILGSERISTGSLFPVDRVNLY